MSGSTRSYTLKSVTLNDTEPINAAAIRRGHHGLSTQPRYSAVEQVGHYFYAYGSLSYRIGPSSRWAVIAVLDFPQKMWRWIYCPGCGLQGSKVFLYNDALYMFGARDWQGKVSREMSKFDLMEESWSYALSSGEKPVNRSYFSGHFMEYRNQFMIFGGTADKLINEVNLLQMPECRWIKPVVKGNPPAGRWQHGSCIYKGVFYCYGGWGRRSRLDDGLYLLHFGHTDIVTWSKPKTMPEDFTPMSSFAFVPFGDVLLMCGGYSGTYLHYLSVFDLATGEFSHVEGEADNPELGFGAAVLPIHNGRALFILGGTAHFSSYIELSSEGV